MNEDRQLDRERRRIDQAIKRARRRRRLLGVGATVVIAAAVGAAATSTSDHARAHARASTAVAHTRRSESGVATRRVLRLPASLPIRTLRVPILMYHRIDLVKPTLPAITQRLTVDPRVFAEQMVWLEEHGYHAVSQLQLFEALEHGAPLPPKPVMLTFDDGYRDVLGKASPVLKRLGMPATAYVITARISGGDPSFLTWGNLHALEQRGITIGSHTVHHVELPSLSDAAALAELRDSRARLERKLGHPVQWFAYPAGAEDARVVALVRQAGYVLAVTTRTGTSQDASDPLELHRYEVLDSTGVTGLAALLAG